MEPSSLQITMNKYLIVYHGQGTVLKEIVNY